VTSASAFSSGRGNRRIVPQARVRARDDRGVRIPPGGPGRPRQHCQRRTRRGARFLIGVVVAFTAPGFGDSASFAGPPTSGPPPTLSPGTSDMQVVPAGVPALPKSRPILTVASTTLLGGYRRFIGSQDVPSCRFAPSCSGFMQEAVERGGLLRGMLLGADRITRCHPWSSPQAAVKGTARRADGLIQDPVTWYLRPAPSTTSRSERGQWVAAPILSAVLPGAGKAYCGRGADGLQSLLMVGTAALLACRGFERNGRRSLEGWGAAGVGAVFYAGGIVGAAASADLCGGWDAEKRLRTRTPRRGSGTSRAPDPHPGGSDIPACDGAGAAAGTGIFSTPEDSARAQPFVGRGVAGHGISPAAAVLFSSIVPGSGQMLSGSPGRGLNAFLLNVGLGTGAGVLARDRRFVEAALLFSLGFLRYYHGNLYWAARLAAERSGRHEPDPGRQHW